MEKFLSGGLTPLSANDGILMRLQPYESNIPVSVSTFDVAAIRLEWFDRDRHKQGIEPELS